MTRSSAFGTSRSLRGAAAIFALIGVLSLACTRGVGAQAIGDEAYKVSSAGLDLASRDGAAQMLDRIRRAAVSVCSTQGADPVYATDGYFGCVRRTTAHAVALFDDPRLTALYRGDGDRATLASRH
jgi:UrcA family protein